MEARPPAMNDGETDDAGIEPETNSDDKYGNSRGGINSLS
jgi:hypothetical protein